jgi:putative ABC transport system substrate-binding protein
MSLPRRQFITLLGGAVAWPLAARAQQPALPVIGFLWSGSSERTEALIAAFHKGLSETGYVEGRNVAVEYRFAGNEYGRLPEMAADLVRRRVAVLVAPGDTRAAFAAKAATGTIPIVFSTGADPVEVGLVESINRPGGNVTGISYMNTELAAKRLGLLHELLPGVTRFAVLVNPDGPTTTSVAAQLQAGASTIGGQVEVLRARTSRGIDMAFASYVQDRIGGLLINTEALFVDRLVQILTLAARHAVAAIYPARFWAEAGGLMSYGSSYSEQARQAGIYTGRVLKGEKPADLPILRATMFEFVINLQTARIFGVEIPATLLARADEVIE